MLLRHPPQNRKKILIIYTHFGGLPRDQIPCPRKVGSTEVTSSIEKQAWKKPQESKH